MQNYYQKFLIAVILVSISSCGFHLRGSQQEGETAKSSVYVIDARSSAVGRELRTQLSVSEGDIPSSIGEAEFSVQLSDSSIVQSVLSVSAITGKIEEYQLLLTVRMTVTDKTKNERITNQLIRITRDYAFDDQAVLGSESERQSLEDEMTIQAAAQIIRRINTLSP
ncbi:MAG: LPS-assembly lipoprotein LptE [Gammaproteobacteria bacterium]|jgi:LPS-assembly lipoprotein